MLESKNDKSSVRITKYGGLHCKFFNGLQLSLKNTAALRLAAKFVLAARNGCLKVYRGREENFVACTGFMEKVFWYLSADIQLVSEHGRRHLRSSSYT